MAAAEGVTWLRRVSVVTGDLAATEAFYRASFGFERVSETTHAGGNFEDLLDMPDVRALSVLLQLGREQLELVCYELRGRKYPPGSVANDVSFQHVAIVVADMRAAYDVLVRGGKMTPISTGGPERLPPNTGSVTVFKCRDPEGHPIELSGFPSGVAAPRWHAPHGSGNCLGIDHSAITVAHIDRSLDFYCGVLGMRVSGRSMNHGAEQDRLDGLPSEGIDIVALQPADDASPHIELLGYRPLGRQDGTVAVTDVAATQLTLEVDDLQRLLSRLPAGGSIVSRCPVPIDSDRQALLVRDPDGHLLLLRE